MTVCSISEHYKVAPSVIGSWSLTDIQLMQRYWAYEKLRRDEQNATDSPDKMAKMFGS